VKNKSLLARTAVGALGGIMLVGMAGVAFAAEVEDDTVDVTVAIEGADPVGALTMTVAADSAVLTEGTADAEGNRVFNGALPTVTVSDDRSEVPVGQFWYVTGTSSAFTAAGAPQIGAEHLGWLPNLITEAPEGTEVVEGPQVDTVLDEGPNNVGLVGEELLAMSDSSEAAAPTGSWDANAALFLKTPANVAAGNYSATITLTLWEDALD